MEDGRIFLELIKKRKRNWLGHWLRRDCLLKEESARQKKISDDKQHYDKCTVLIYEKEG